MADQLVEGRDLERQMQTATETIGEAVLRLLQAGEVDPQILVLAMARVTGELGASMALAGEADLAGVLGDLTEVVRQAGREHGDALEVVVMPAAGSA